MIWSDQWRCYREFIITTSLVFTFLHPPREGRRGLILNLFNISNTFMFQVFKYSSIIFSSKTFCINVKNQTFIFWFLIFCRSFTYRDRFFGTFLLGCNKKEKHFYDIKLLIVVFMLVSRNTWYSYGKLSNGFRRFRFFWRLVSDYVNYWSILNTNLSNFSNTQILHLSYSIFKNCPRLY